MQQLGELTDLPTTKMKSQILLLSVRSCFDPVFFKSFSMLTTKVDTNNA